MEHLLSTAEAAARLGIATQTLRAWRGRGTSPKYIRYGHVRARAMYRVADIEAWLREREASSTSQESARVQMTEDAGQGA
jgi:uncharacterized protein YjcR